MKLASSSATSSTDELTTDFDITDFQEQSQPQSSVQKNEPEKRTDCIKLLDPYCHYNTSLNSKYKKQTIVL